jgi:GTP-binding protein
MFIDKTWIKIKAGDGGNGCSSFLREKFRPNGGPNGGDGGRGGNVFIEASEHQQSLIDLTFTRFYQAENGTSGQGKEMHGRAGEDLILKVPVGTTIKDRETGDLIVDLSHNEMRYMLAEGGMGGRGNKRFASSTNRAPRECEVGFPGEELEIELELKTIADIGFVGYPNAGKSTLLGALSAAKPKVAPYPFTTLPPVVGVVEFKDFYRFTIADIPGLIEGAHENVGLGHEFLRHIERTKILTFVLDMAGVDGRTPWEDYESLKEELELYMKGLSTRKSIIIANKMDLEASKENLQLLQQEYPNAHIFPISAATDEDFSELKIKMRELINNPDLII